MTVQGWRIAFASSIGTSHLKLGGVCQDSSMCRLLTDTSGGTVAVLVTSDGAGSASDADRGSRTACQAMQVEIAEYVASGGRVAAIARPNAAVWISRARSAIAAQAQENGKLPRDYACTLLAAIIGEDAAAFLQIGDGAIVVSDSSQDWHWVYWPQRGEYTNMTYFLTEDDAIDRLDFSVRHCTIDEVGLFTDGIESLVLHYATQTVHAAFFNIMLRPLRESPNDGVSEHLSDALTRYLASAAICQRTDDDKSLILATRRLSPGAGEGACAS